MVKELPRSTLQSEGVMTSSPQYVRPEDLVVAVFHLLKDEKIIVVDDERFSKLFHDVSSENPAFRKFSRHPIYHDSSFLDDIIHTLDMGGVIHRFNADAELIQPTRLALGDYGRSRYDALDSPLQEIVKNIAERVCDVFTARDTNST